MKEFSNAPQKKEGDKRIQQWPNYNGAYTADGMTANCPNAKDPSTDLPEPSKFVKRCQLNYCA